jgi:hypothetical protein
MNEPNKDKGSVIAIGVLLVAGAWIGSHWTWDKKDEPAVVEPPAVVLPAPVAAAAKATRCLDDSVFIEAIHADDGWRWHAQSVNGKLLCSGEAYQNRVDMESTIHLLFGSVQIRYVQEKAKIPLTPVPGPETRSDTIRAMRAAVCAARTARGMPALAETLNELAQIRAETGEQLSAAQVRGANCKTVTAQIWSRTERGAAAINELPDNADEDATDVGYGVSGNTFIVVFGQSDGGDGPSRSGFQIT